MVRSNYNGRYVEKLCQDISCIEKTKERKKKETDQTKTGQMPPRIICVKLALQPKESTFVFLSQLLNIKLMITIYD